jgi:hypothetical protein
VSGRALVQWLACSAGRIPRPIAKCLTTEKVGQNFRRVTSAKIELEFGNRRPLPTKQQVSPQSHVPLPGGRYDHTIFPCVNRNWRTLYRTAILETNKSVLPQRVSEAEEAVRARGRELFYAAAGSLEEKEALEDALYDLRAFRTAWEHTEAA